VNALGIVGLVVGLWLVTPGARPIGRDAVPPPLAWLLVAASGLLILTSVLAPPDVTDSDSLVTDPALPAGYHAVYPPTPRVNAPATADG
jgi:hypothetical protein